MSTDEMESEGQKNQQQPKVSFDERRLEKLTQRQDDDNETDGDQYYHRSPLARTLSSFRGKGPRQRTSSKGLASSSDDFVLEHNDRQDFASSGTVEVPMTLSLNEEGQTLSVDSSAVALSWKVPPKRGARWSAAFASKSSSRKKLGYFSCTSRLGYDVLPTTQLYTELEFGTHGRSQIGTLWRFSNSSSLQIGLGTIPQGEPGNMSIHISGRRNILKDRIASTATFTMDSRQRFHVLQLGFRTVAENNLPKLSLGLNLGVNTPPIELTAESPRGLVSIGMGRRGILFDGMLQRTLSNFAAIGVGVRAAAGKGLSWTFQLDRGDFSMKIPVTICTGLDGYSAIALMYLTFLSGIVDGVIGDLIDSSNTKVFEIGQGDENGRKLTRTSSMLRLEKVREDAERQSSLMKRQADSKRKKEEAKDGLVIDQAIYYVDGAGGGRLDVSTQLQFWVTDSSLCLPPTSKSNLLGFYDVRKRNKGMRSKTSPLNWNKIWRDFWDESTSGEEVAMLYVRYIFEGGKYEITVRDDDQLVLPSPSAAKVNLEAKKE